MEGEAHAKTGRGAQNASSKQKAGGHSKWSRWSKAPKCWGKGTKALPEAEVHSYLDASVSHGDPFLLCESGFAGSDELSPRPLMLTNFTPKQ